MNAKAASAQPPKPAVKKQKHRSPNHPVLTLEKTIELAGKLRADYGTHQVPVMLVHKLSGYKEGNAQGDQCVAALKAFGLVDVIGKGDSRKVSLSKEGDRIVRAAPDRDFLVEKAALLPPVHKEVVEHYGSQGLPNDVLLRQYLVWERPEGQRFNEDAVDGYIARLRQDLEFAKVQIGDKLGEEVDDESDPEDDPLETDASRSNPDAGGKPLRNPPRDIPPAGSPFISFPLSDGNSVEIRLKKKVSPKDFERIKTLVELSEASLVDDGGEDDHE